MSWRSKWAEEDRPVGRVPKSCQKLTISMDCYADPIQQTWGSWPTLGPSFHECSQETFTVLLRNQTKQNRGKGFKDCGNERGLLVNFFETFPSVVFADIIVVGLDEFFDRKPSSEQYKRFLTLLFKQRPKKPGLRLHPSHFGARILFRTHRGHKRSMDKYYGQGGTPVMR